MKIRKGMELRDVCGEKVVIAEGLENLDFSKMINLNESAAYLWKAIEKRDFSESDLVDLLCKEYEVDRETATVDIRSLIASWKDEGLIVE